MESIMKTSPIFFAAALLVVATRAPAQTTLDRARREIAVDTARIMTDVRTLAHDSMQGREAGTEGGARARAFLLRRFQEVELQLPDGGFERPFTFRTGGRTVHAVNLVGVIPGTDADGRVIVVTAHYDHVGVQNGEIHNGADDNASGAAGLLALAEHFVAHPPRNTLVIAALDAEEKGLQGARAFVATPPQPLARVAANVNMDMVSRSEAGELWLAGTYHYPALLPLVERIAGRSDVRLRIGHDRPGLPPGDDWTTASDHGPFHAAGIPFLYFGVEDHPGYHKPTDDAEHIRPSFYAAAVATVIDAVAELDTAVARGEPLK
jgi:Zn-dependent M28 family amino/carboxypeptidase